MMRSMYSGVSGLRSHQTKMDVIGNNIANVNTIGYKSQRVTFSEVFSQTVQAGTGASEATGRGGRNPMQVGLGVSVGSIDSKMTTGSAQRTDNAFDLMVNGDGFIVVADAQGQYYTKSGALRVDEEGNLVIPNGMKVQGWPSRDGVNIEKGEVQNINLADPSIKFAEPATTSKTAISGNISTQDVKSAVPVQIKVYDSLGNLYTTNLQMKYDAAAAPPVWNITPQEYDANGDLAAGGGNIKLTDSTGKSVLVPVATAFPTLPSLAFDTTGKLDIASSTGLTAEGTFAMAAFDVPGLNATIGTPGTRDISIDITGLTQYSSKTNLDSKTLDGRTAGAMTGYDVGGDGIITAYYDNGEIKKIAQIVVAEFTNPSGLERAGDNVFKATASSGMFDGIGKEAIFQAGVLEMSNVDLSAEFTEMIVTQRGFQANSKIITASDEMLQELVNLKR